MMNILLLAPHPFFQNRGTPIAVRTLVQVLTEGGHRIDLLAYHEGEDVCIEGCQLHRIPALPGVHGVRPGFSFKKLICDVAMFFKAYSMMRKNRYDVVHAVEESAFMAWLFRKRFDAPYVYDMDSSLAQQMIEKYPWLVHVGGFLGRSEKLVVDGSIGVVAVCKSLQEAAHGYSPHKPVLRLEDITLLDWENTRIPEVESSLDVERPIAMYVGSLEPYQGIDLLLDAFKVTKDSGTGGSLVIVGGGESDIAKYKRKSRDLGISNDVHLLGVRPVEHLAAYLSRADVLLSPRIKGYNTPMKIYSYLDSGKPLLATRLSTHTQVLDEDISLLVDPEPQSMGRGLTRLFKDGELAASLADNAKQRVEAEFTLEAFRRKLMGFYGELETALDEGKRRPNPKHDGRRDFVERMFSKSVMKQAKYEQIVDLLGKTDGLTCLDLGGDNGVISLLLRKRGGTWYSADLSPETVASIESVVGERVFRVDTTHTPFENAQFDRVVVVDLLEHITTDREFVADLRRVIRDDGVLIVNVPHLKRRSILNRVRHVIGQTDERHGHVRPGYSVETLRRTLSPWFTIREVRTYSRAFSELVDTAMRFAVDLVKGHKTGVNHQPHKGNIVTQEDVEKSGGGFGLISLTYPFVKLFCLLDHLLFLQQGYKLTVLAEVNEAGGPGEDRQ